MWLLWQKKRRLSGENMRHYIRSFILQMITKAINQPAIDAFVVGTRPYHYQIAQEILLANKDVLLENQ